MRQDPYELLAQLYDQDVHLGIPGAFFRTLRPLVRAQRRGPPILDLGSGSGLLTERLAGTGARVIGVDGSRPMLALARQRCRPYGARVSLLHSKLDRFRLAAPVRLAVSSGDVVNHLDSRAHVARFFLAVRKALLPGGAFVFDTITRHCFETYWPDNTHVLEGPAGDMVLDCDWDPARLRGTAKITSYVRRTRDTFSRTKTVLYEYYYSDEQIMQSLVRAGFARVWRRSWCPWSPQDCRSRDGFRDRRLWCAGVAGPARAAVSPSALGFKRVH